MEISDDNKLSIIWQTEFIRLSLLLPIVCPLLTVFLDTMICEIENFYLFTLMVLGIFTNAQLTSLFNVGILVLGESCMRNT